MRRLAGSFGRGALLVVLAAGAAWGQESSGISVGGALDARRFDSIRLVWDVKSGAEGKMPPETAPSLRSWAGSVLAAAAQSGGPDGQTAAAAKPARPTVHRFWDTENILLFAGVGAARGLDYASTLNIRRRGIDEALLTNAIVDNHPEFAAIEAATTAASVGLSYIFHRIGHHRLERWTSYIHIGVTVAGAGRNYALKTVHPGT